MFQIRAPGRLELCGQRDHWSGQSLSGWVRSVDRFPVSVGHLVARRYHRVVTCGPFSPRLLARGKHHLETKTSDRSLGSAGVRSDPDRSGLWRMVSHAGPALCPGLHSSSLLHVDRLSLRASDRHVHHVVRLSRRNLGNHSWSGAICPRGSQRIVFAAAITHRRVCRHDFGDDRGIGRTKRDRASRE